MSKNTAHANFQQHLVDNSYPGRGIVAGRSETGEWIQVYWIMGRSANSRNRVFVVEEEALRTQAADPAKVKDPTLIIYHAMRRLGSRFIATNGAQTDAIYDALVQGAGFVSALIPWAHEPDAPNYTPRISTLLDASVGEVWMSIIKAAAFGEPASEHHFFRYTTVDPGFGYALTTYAGDGDPLPPFSGAPYVVPLRGDAETVLAEYWEALNADNRISLAVRSVDPVTHASQIRLINQYESVG